MPNFRVDLVGSHVHRVWADPASVDLPSRITGTHERQHYKVRLPVGQPLALHAVLDGQSGPVDDATGGVFETWALEYPSAAEPQQTHSAGWSSMVDLGIDTVGHYTIGMFHKSTGSPAVIVHIDSESSP